MAIRVLGSDDNFIDDRFYCTGYGAIGRFKLDFPDTDTAIECAEYLRNQYPDTQYKVIEEDEILTKEIINSLWYSPEFNRLEEDGFFDVS